MKTFGIIAAVIVVAVVAYKLALFPTYAHRYRLTLEVETPDGLRTGSGVIEARLKDQPNLLPDVGTVSALKGDAVFVDLGHGKNVTALLALGQNGSNVSGPVTLAVKAFDCTQCQSDLSEWSNLVHKPGTRELPPKLTPTLVTLTNVNDPETARVVRPDEFETVFGPGYRFKRAWIEMTDDRVTRGIRDVFPWVGNYAAEKRFEQRLRETGGPGGGSRMPGMNLSRN